MEKYKYPAYLAKERAIDYKPFDESLTPQQYYEQGFYDGFKEAVDDLCDAEESPTRMSYFKWLATKTAHPVSLVLLAAILFYLLFNFLMYK